MTPADAVAQLCEGATPRIHLAVSGGGSGLIGTVCGVPEVSSVFEGASVPYSRRRPGSSFVLGSDALARLLDPSWCPVLPMLEELRHLGARLFVVGRGVNSGADWLEALAIPAGFRDLFVALPGHYDVSSSALRVGTARRGVSRRRSVDFTRVGHLSLDDPARPYYPVGDECLSLAPSAQRPLGRDRTVDRGGAGVVVRSCAKRATCASPGRAVRLHESAHPPRPPQHRR